MKVHGVGETRWHWKVRSIYRDNRFDNLAWHKGVDYRYKLARDNPRKDVQAVFVVGVLNSPATNRGVGQWESMYFRCYGCDSVGRTLIEPDTVPTGRFYCYDCDPSIPF